VAVAGSGGTATGAGLARGAGQPAPLALRARRSRGVVRRVLAELALEVAQLVAGPQPGALDAGTGLAVLVGELEHRLGQLAGHDLDDGGDALS
jgi:hypothetical protein